MAKLYLTCTRAQAPALQAVLMVLFDLPRKVNHIGSGAIVDPDPTASGVANARCWMTRAQPFIKNPANTGASTDEFAIEVTDELQSLWAAKQALFKPAVVTTIQAQVTSAAALSSAWNTTDPETGTVYLGSEDMLPADKSTVLL